MQAQHLDYRYVTLWERCLRQAQDRLPRPTLAPDAHLPWRAVPGSAGESLAAVVEMLRGVYPEPVEGLSMTFRDEAFVNGIFAR